MRNIKSLLLLAILFITVIITESCVNHDIKPPGEIDCEGFQTVSFNNDIKGILVNHCAVEGCHNGDNGEERNWKDPQKFQDHAFEARRRVQLPASDPDHMPAAGEISEEQIKLIVCWANQGAPINN